MVWIFAAVAVVSAAAGYATAVYLRGMHMTPSSPATMNHSTMKMDHGAMVKTEKDFLVGMIPHHEEAVQSAQELIARTTDPALTLFLREVIRAQESEIAQMEAWHLAWYMREYVDDGSYTPMMQSLPRNTPVAQYEKTWLTDMIVHHEAAVDMARAVLSIDGIHAETRKLAENIVTVQVAEIEQMKEMLKTR